MKTLIVTVGLPRSGKSTWAKSTGYPVVSQDAIQYAACGKHLEPLKEFKYFNDLIGWTMIKALFLAGHDNVIYDACNHTKVLRNKWKDFCKLNNFNLEFKFIDTPAEECIRRAQGFRNAEYLTKCIKTMTKELDYKDDL